MKGQARNIDTFKVGAKGVNEFDFHKNQGEMHEHHENNQEQGAGKVQTKAEASPPGLRCTALMHGQPGSMPFTLMTAAAVGEDRNRISARATSGSLALVVMPAAHVNFSRSRSSSGNQPISS